MKLPDKPKTPPTPLATSPLSKYFFTNLEPDPLSRQRPPVIPQTCRTLPTRPSISSNQNTQHQRLNNRYHDATDWGFVQAVGDGDVEPEGGEQQLPRPIDRSQKIKISPQPNDQRLLQKIIRTQSISWTVLNPSMKIHQTIV